MDDISQEAAKFKQQFQYDFQQFNTLKNEYYEWFERCNKFSEKVERCLESVSIIISDFNSQYKKLEEVFVTENNKKFYDGKIKGISMVLKMLNNVVDINCKIFHNILVMNMPVLIRFDEIEKKDLLQIQHVANENYNNICNIRNKRDELIKDYFKFVNVYLLNIIDGIKAGIDYVSSTEENDEIIKLIEGVYEKLLEKMEDLLKQLDISRIDVKKFEMYNYMIHQVFDVQETNNSDIDGRIYEITKYGYIYKDTIYMDDYRHIVRPAEVIVYKYMYK
ncbi:nucleotide exchange factor GrpE [Clostridium sp. WILCCON 0269]|uniref:Nucleotide exchange factor GrpE n=1 Tax=Candidatus Clostridium eludens TaxID=3381663 RepID=A0ABW8SDN8_9CLOT